MPIIVRDFTWKQTADRVTIQVPLHEMISAKRLDVFTSPQYLKATCEKYIFEALLLHPVDAERSSCTHTANFILFDLKKCQEQHWDSLEMEDISGQEKQQMKIRLIQQEHERIRKQTADKAAKKVELKRLAVNAQIALDTRTRNRIDAIKKTEEEKALGDLTEWKEKLEPDKPRIVELDNSSEEEESSSPDEEPERYAYKPKPPPIIPKPRGNRALQILFTPREFPTPLRESHVEEETQFLAKQAEARRSAGFLKEDLKPEEKNPQHLLAKGREFQKNKNYIGAISAYTFGIKLAPKFLDLYVERSYAHFMTKNFYNCIKDCSSALDLLKPALPVNLEQRALCFGRRGFALFKLGFRKEGIAELEASIKLRQNEEFQRHLEGFREEYAKMKEEYDREEKLRQDEKKAAE